ncbi:MAG: metal-dependent transcriptional regulator [Lachnospiraceae bacterium]|nr:metal-dependent transcriptional regulator [Lachnospiraceae bacterium]
MSINTNESREDYLESILVIKREKGAVRSIDIANHFGYSRPSISRAVGLLRKDELVVVDDSGYIELTPKGMEMAKGVYSRHRTLIRFLNKLGVSPETAEADACRIEHILSEESMDRIKAFVNAD